MAGIDQLFLRGEDEFGKSVDRKRVMIEHEKG